MSNPSLADWIKVKLTSLVAISVGSVSIKLVGRMASADPPKLDLFINRVDESECNWWSWWAKVWKVHVYFATILDSEDFLFRTFFHTQPTRNRRFKESSQVRIYTAILNLTPICTNTYALTQLKSFHTDFSQWEYPYFWNTEESSAETKLWLYSQS